MTSNPKMTGEEAASTLRRLISHLSEENRTAMWLAIDALHDAAAQSHPPEVHPATAKLLAAVDDPGFDATTGDDDSAVVPEHPWERYCAAYGGWVRAGRPGLAKPAAAPSNVGCDYCNGSESDHERGCVRLTASTAVQGGEMVPPVAGRCNETHPVTKRACVKELGHYERHPGEVHYDGGYETWSYGDTRHDGSETFPAPFAAAPAAGCGGQFAGLRGEMYPCVLSAGHADHCRTYTGVLFAAPAAAAPVADAPAVVPMRCRNCNATGCVPTFESGMVACPQCEGTCLYPPRKRVAPAQPSPVADVGEGSSGWSITDFGSRLRAAREGAGMSQAALAEQTGLPASSISHFEIGGRLPSHENLGRLCRVLGMTTEYLFGPAQPAPQPSGMDALIEAVQLLRESVFDSGWNKRDEAIGEALERARRTR